MFVKSSGPPSNQGDQKSFTFSENGTGTILLYQNYCNLFYTQTPLEKQIFQAALTFLDKDGGLLFTLIIFHDRVTLDRFYQDKKAFPPITEFFEKRFLPIFPGADKAPELLYKKLWVQVNRLTNTVNVSVGDVYNAEKERLLFYDFDEDFPETNLHKNWAKSDTEFQMPPTAGNVGSNGYNPRVKNILALANKVNIKVTAQRS